MKDELNTANLLTTSNTAEVLLGLSYKGMEVWGFDAVLILTNTIHRDQTTRYIVP